MHPQQSFILSILPRAWGPYAELMRLNKPAGYFAFFWQVLIGLTYSFSVSRDRPTIHDQIYAVAYYAFWTVLIRGTVCTVNDICDQDFDRQVERTKYRALPRGAISTGAATIFAIVQSIITTIVIRPMVPFVWWGSMTMMIVLSVYPLVKRISNYPSVFLGFGIALPAGFGPTMWQLHKDTTSDEPVRQMIATACIYLACTIWSITIDLIYAHQDKKDDVKAGVGSLALRLGESTKLALLVLGVLQFALCVFCGILSEFSISYYLVGCGGVGASLYFQLTTVDLHNPASCAWWFGPGSKYLAIFLISGLLMQSHTLNIENGSLFAS